MKRFLYNQASIKNKRRSLRKKQTDTERKLWHILRGKQMAGLKFIRQYSVDRFILDFYCPSKRLAIEVDGGQHAEKIYKLYDDRRSAYLIQNDIRVIRFWDNDVLNNIEGVWQKIREAIEKIS